MPGSDAGGFDPWDVVKVPFPYTDRPVRQRRPALVVSDRSLAAEHRLVWVVMITSAENRGWPGDVEIADHGAAGLPSPSVVRTAKIATIDARDAERLGCLPPPDRSAVAGHLARHLAAVSVSGFRPSER
ncbi:MAG: type II toxin-antitoxin system PemK/MazF family toxin [Candidatus Hydrogenedens sp.]|nr:type II toxin-antitoxin system PemK/MazF family toxin [Candidatus Hydrogenedens sp.]